MKPGAMVIADREIVLNEGKETRELLVANVGDRPVQVSGLCIQVAGWFIGKEDFRSAD